MMVVFDTTMLLPFLAHDVPAPISRETNTVVGSYHERIAHLVQTLEESRTKILIPTPVLSEVLVRAGPAGSDYLSQINAAAVFRIVPFDQKAAVELAVMTREAIESGDKRGGSIDSWAKVKFDRQIVAIAKSEGAKIIYSDDDNLASFAQKAGLTVIGSPNLPLPPVDPQGALFSGDEEET